MNQNPTFASRRALLRGCDFPITGANPFAAGPRPAFYADGGDPPPADNPPALTADTPIPEALRAELGLGDAGNIGAVAKMLKDTQTALRNPQPRTESYTMDGVTLGEGVDEAHIRSLMPIAQAAGVSQEGFARLANANTEAFKKETAEWREGAEKEFGGADGLTKLQNQIRVFGDKEFSLTGMPVESIKALKGMADKLSAAGVMPPGGENDPPAQSASAMSMDYNGEKITVDPESKDSIQKFFNHQIEVDDGKGGTKKVYASEHPATRTQHAELYQRALRASARG